MNKTTTPPVDVRKEYADAIAKVSALKVHEDADAKTLSSNPDDEASEWKYWDSCAAVNEARQVELKAKEAYDKGKLHCPECGVNDNFVVPDNHVCLSVDTDGVLAVSVRDEGVEDDTVLVCETCESGFSFAELKQRGGEGMMYGQRYHDVEIEAVIETSCSYIIQAIIRGHRYTVGCATYIEDSDELNKWEFVMGNYKRPWMANSLEVIKKIFREDIRLDNMHDGGIVLKAKRMSDEFKEYRIAQTRAQTGAEK